MKKYELLLNLPGTLNDKEVEEELQKVLALIKDYGQEGKVDNMGKTRLAYPVKQIRYGYFYTIIFQAEEEKMQELNNKLRLNKGLLRAMISKYDEKVKVVKKVSSVPQIRDKVETKPDPTPVIKKEEKKPAPVKIDLEDIDKKLDEILDDKMINV